MVAELAAAGEAVVAEAVVVAEAPVAELPAPGGLLVEIAAMEHVQWNIRMFTT